MRKYNLKNGYGITLIVLVVTIVVLLILSGISISMLTGQNGILNRASEAKEKTSSSQKQEKKNLANMEELINEKIAEKSIEQVNDANPGVLEQENENIYVINSIEDLVFFSYDVRNGNTYEGKTVKLGTSLDFNSVKSYSDAFRTDYGKYGYDGEIKNKLTSEDGFIPVGTIKYSEAEVSNINTFSGVFDGNNNYIANLLINREFTYTGDDYEEFKLGLFGYNKGTIKNVIINDCNISVKKISGNCNVFAGGVVGQNQGDIDNCSVSGSVSSNFIVGGISGRNKANIVSSHNEANVYGEARVGGISGDASGDGIFTKNYNIGEIVSKSNNAETSGAGICGSGKLIESCFNKGKINVKSDELCFAYGIGGADNIRNCYNIGDVYAEISNNTSDSNCSSAAGICAYWGKDINNCYNAGKITSKGNLGYVRGSGIAYGSEVNNSYNFGEINTLGTEKTENQSGGISAHSEGKDFTNCHNEGAIVNKLGIANKNKIGGIVGAGNEQNTTITNCSYLAASAEKGTGSGTDTTIRVENKKDMPTPLPILGDKFKESSNSEYPILTWQEE